MVPFPNIACIHCSGISSATSCEGKTRRNTEDSIVRPPAGSPPAGGWAGGSCRSAPGGAGILPGFGQSEDALRVVSEPVDQLDGADKALLAELETIRGASLRLKG